MSMVDFAKRELERLGKDEEGMQDQINNDILEIVEVFAKQGHSGFSASYVLSVLKRLLAQKPITPLTGEENEWNDINGEIQQNNRCSTVFRMNNDNSSAYNIEGKVFSDDGGKTWFTNKDSCTPVTFPYQVPEKPEYVILE